jgi:hypothetical protein
VQELEERRERAVKERTRALKNKLEPPRRPAHNSSNRLLLLQPTSTSNARFNIVYRLLVIRGGIDEKERLLADFPTTHDS